jgi:hypothetical protein
MLAAGDTTQEALRNVPPPRLPFWMNARRRLLDAAATSNRPALQPMALVMRAGLSAAVVVAAVVLAGAAYLTTQSQPQSVDAQLAYLEEQLDQVELQQAKGQPVDVDLLVDLSHRTQELLKQLGNQPEGPVADKLPEIIERQKDVVSSVVSVGTPPPALVQAAAQLESAEETAKALAARNDVPTPPAAAVASPIATQPAPATTPTAEATRSASTPTATPGPVQAGQVDVRLLTDDRAAGLFWVQFRTSSISFLVPSEWTATGIVAENGVPKLQTTLLAFSNSNLTVLVDLETGGIDVLLNGQPFVLRTGGPNSATISAEDLQALAGPYSAILTHISESVTLIGEDEDEKPTPTPSPTNTPSPSPTPSPTPTATATPTTPPASPTPSATATNNR